MAEKGHLGSVEYVGCMQAMALCKLKLKAKALKLLKVPLSSADCENVHSSGSLRVEHSEVVLLWEAGF